MHPALPRSRPTARPARAHPPAARGPQRLPIGSARELSPSDLTAAEHAALFGAFAPTVPAGLA